MYEILNLGRGPVVKVWVIHVTKSRTLGQRWSGWPFPRGDACAQRMRVNPSPWALFPFSQTVRLPGETGYSASIHIWSEILELYQRTETQKGLFLSAGLPNNMIHSSLCFAPPPLSALYPDWPIICCFYLPETGLLCALTPPDGLRGSWRVRKEGEPITVAIVFPIGFILHCFFFKGK